jgi:hypothetical protein
MSVIVHVPGDPMKCLSTTRTKIHFKNENLLRSFLRTIFEKHAFQFAIYNHWMQRGGLPFVLEL